MKYLQQSLRPILQKLIASPKDFDVFLQQYQKDMERPDFWAVWPLMVAWGRKPFPDEK